MTREPAEMSLVEIRESTPAGQQGMAAARLALRVRGLMQSALKVSGLSQKELAQRMQLGESRVSQILNGDGNIQISTLARVFRAIGYKIDFVAEPIDESVAPLPDRRKRSPRRAGPSPVSQASGKTDRLTIARGGRHGLSVKAVDFPVFEDDDEAFYVLTHRDFTETHTSNGWNISAEWNIEMSASNDRRQSMEGMSNA